MPLQATSGAASYDAFGGGVPVAVNYIEDVFSCFLYSGTNAAQTITNNIDLSTYGGLVWQKPRTSATKHRLFSTSMTLGRSLSSNTIFAEDTAVNITSYSTTGFTVASPISDTGTNYVTWTFRKQPKFFDVQTWTGSGANRTISHDLGSVPACIIVKCIDDDLAWAVYHRSLANTQYLVLNDTAAAATGATWWNSTTPTSSVFSLGTNSTVNASAKTYIAYIFAHDAGGFGLTGTDNVISCGSYTGTGSTLSITLGYEPQWVMIKRTDTTADWQIIDNMRGWTADGVCQRLVPNTSAAEAGPTGSTFLFPTATGFGSAGSSAIVNASGGTYIYIAIRRGPMKVPTSGTSVYESGTQLSTSPSFVSGFPVDLAMRKYTGISDGWNQVTRLQGTATLGSDSTAAETTGVAAFTFDYQTGWSTINSADSGIRSWMMRRAPSFMDVVCYTGTGSARTVTHNLAAVPELIIVKRRSASNSWYIYNSTIGAANALFLNAVNASTADNAAWNSTSPTNTVFTVNTESAVNFSGQTYVAYLFATCAGVSKVGSYTGTATTLQVDCGFTAGSRFVLIKRTDSTGDWYVWDSARGIVSGNDSYILLNTTAAEVTNTDYIDTYSAGFEISSTAPAAINASGGTFIFLAIA